MIVTRNNRKDYWETYKPTILEFLNRVDNWFVTHEWN